MWKITIKSHTLFFSLLLHLCYLFSPSCCCISFIGGAVWVHAVSLFFHTFYSPLKGPPGLWLLVQSVSKLPRLPSRFLTSSPPWDRAFHVLSTESGLQVSCNYTVLYMIFALCLDLQYVLRLPKYVWTNRFETSVPNWQMCILFTLDWNKDRMKIFRKRMCCLQEEYNALKYMWK